MKTLSATVPLRVLGWGWILLLLLFATPVAGADESTIKVGILHSLSGTMAISEAVLKDTVLMLIDDQNRKGGLLGRKLVPVVVEFSLGRGYLHGKAHHQID